MWFKNLIVFYFEQTPDWNQDELETRLVESVFTPCGSQELMSLGWTAPMESRGELLSHMGSDGILLTAKREDRLLPASVIREEVHKKVRALESEQDRKIGRKERLEIRENLTFELTPKAFTRSSLIRGLILPKQKLLVVDAATWKKAEEWVSLLRETLGSLAVRPVEFNHSVSHTFTGWLSGDIATPSIVEIGDECELRSNDEQAAVIRCRYQDLGSDEIRQHIKAGKSAVKLSFEWNDSLSLVLNEKLEIKRLRFSDTLIEQASEDGAADAAAEFDASFTLMTLELTRFLPALFDLFGGLNETV